MDDELLRDGARVAVRCVALMVAGSGYPSADLASPDTLVLVHMVCIGWLERGDVRRAVPVRARPCGRAIVFREVGLAGLGLLTAGLAALLAGFLALGGRPAAWLWLLPVGAVLLVAGFGLVVVDLGLTAWLRPPGPARFVLVGLASLCATVRLRRVFAFALAGWAWSIWNAVLAAGVPLHAIAGLGGWLTLTAMGVSYRLLSMFMLSPDVDDRKSTMTLAAGALAIAMRWSAASSRSGSARIERRTVDRSHLGLARPPCTGATCRDLQ